MSEGGNESEIDVNNEVSAVPDDYIYDDGEGEDDEE